MIDSKTQREWSILPTEKGAERKRRELLANSERAVFLGNSVFSLSHFFNTIAQSSKPILSQKTGQHLLQTLLKNHPLKYFEKLRHLPHLAEIFGMTIRRLKEHAITPDNLEKALQETGSLKEYDLFRTYQRYEELKEKLGVFDREDTFHTAQKNGGNPEGPLKGVRQLTFENFQQIPLALRQLLQTLTDQCPDLVIEVQSWEAPDPDRLKNTTLFSLPTPHQEAQWFIENFILQKEDPNKASILIGSQFPYYEMIWQKLKWVNLVEGASPFLKWSERPEGRIFKRRASEIILNRAPLEKWLALLLKSDGPTELIDSLEKYFFAESLQSLGELSQKEWILWLNHALEERPTATLPESLKGIQWVSLEGGDFPECDSLWAPGLTEEQFSLQSQTNFFQEKKDRSRPEWESIVQAFPDPKLLLQQKREAFLHFLTKPNQGAWLTYPRLSSDGQDRSPSPLIWNFVETRLEAQQPYLLLDPTTTSFWQGDPKHIREKLKIEQERQCDDLQTKPYHADLVSLLPEPLEVQKEKHFFSPTQLESYARCPFQYYAQRVLEIPQRKEYSPEVDPEDRGTLFHKVLETFFSQEGKLYQEAIGNPSQEEILFERLRKIVDQVFTTLKEKVNYAHAELYTHLKESVLQQAKEIIANELQNLRETEVPLLPRHFEWGFEFSLDDSRQKPIHLKGFVDRIDGDDAKKRFMVLDYKTGQTTTLKEKLLEGLSLQLPLYLLAVRKLLLQEATPVGGLLISVREGKRKHGLVDAAFNQVHFKMRKNAQALMSQEEMKTVINQTMEHIRNYVGQIRKGYFSPRPKDCQTHCDYKEICRYAYKPVD